jgi:hypothetical protein
MPSSSTPSTRTFMTESSKPEPDKTPKQPKNHRFVSKRGLPWLLVGILLLVSVFLYLQYRQAQDNTTVAEQNSKYQKQLSQLILVPGNETPTIATIKDASKLSKQVFFKDAQNGDKLFVYSKSHKAILYRPSSNMIINVQTVNVTPNATSGSAGLNSQ